MMKRFTVFSLLAILLLGFTLQNCQKNHQQAKPSPKDLLSPLWLSYMQARSENPDPVNIEFAQQNYQRAQKLKAENKILEAIDRIEKAIALQANASAYVLYGDLLLVNNRAKDATKAYKLAEMSGFDNLQQLYIQLALSEAQLKNANETLKYLVLAQHQGANLDALLKKHPSLSLAGTLPQIKEKSQQLLKHQLLPADQLKTESIAGKYSYPGYKGSVSTILCKNGTALRSFQCQKGYEIFRYQIKNGSVWHSKIADCRAAGVNPKKTEDGCGGYESYKFNECDRNRPADEPKEKMLFSAVHLSHAVKKLPAKTYAQLSFENLAKEPIQCNADFVPKTLQDLEW